MGHSLRGVWVEIPPDSKNHKYHTSHSLRGVWVEISQGDQAADQLGRHSLRGVWVEIDFNFFHKKTSLSLPSGSVG